MAKIKYTRPDMVKFDDLPPARPFKTPGRSRELDPLREALKAEPGRWAKIGEYPPSTKFSSVSRPLGAGFQVRQRKQEDGTVHVWARYIGESGEFKEEK